MARRSGATSGSGDLAPAPLGIAPELPVGEDIGTGLECAEPPFGDVGADACISDVHRSMIYPELINLL